MAVLTKNYQKIGEKYLGSSYGDLYIRIYAKYSEQDINNNRSKVQYQARAYFSGNYIYDEQSSGNVKGTGASQVNYSKSSSYNNGETPLGTTEGWVSHNNDGKATITGSAYLNFPNWSWSGTASGSADLPTIPRNSTITATSAYIEEVSQLTITRYKEEYTHSIAYSFGSLSGYILADGTTTSTETKLTELNIGFPIPSTWYAEIPNNQEGVCTLTIKTYNGDTQIGNNYTATFYARVNPTTNKPEVVSSVIDANDDAYALTGNRNILIKNYSIAEVTWSATPKNNATISNVKINDTTVTTSPYNFVLNSNTISVVATDSRELSTTNNPAFTLKDYFVPSLTISSIYRANPTDNFATLQFNGTWFNENFGVEDNTLTLSWKYKETGASNWIDGGNLVPNTDYKIENNNFWSGNGTSANEITIGGNLLLYEKNWDILITATDKITTYQAIGSITKGIPIINWEEDFFNVNGNIKQFNQNIVESGSNANGNYIKYYDGTMICYKSVTATVSITISWGSLYEGTMDLGDWAASFIEKPNIQITNSSGAGCLIESISPSHTTTSAGTVYLVRPSSYTHNFTIDVFGIGKWK
jgi:hypothetical protein